MPFLERTYGKQNHASINEVLISSDSHVIEPAGLWQKELPKAFQDRAPDYGGQRPNDTPGGAQDKNKRVSEMAADGDGRDSQGLSDGESRSSAPGYCASARHAAWR